MPPMENSETETLKDIPVAPANPSTGIGRRRPLRSRTVDTLLHILSLCYADSSHPIQDSDKGDIDKQLAVKDDSVCQEERFVDERREVSGRQEGGLFNKHVESDCDNDISSERNDLAQKSDINSLVMENQDNYNVMISSPHLNTNKDVEEGEISGELMDSMPEDDTSSMDKTGSEVEHNLGIEPLVENDNNAIPNDDMVASKSRRNLVDYSEIALHGRLESRKSDCVPPLQSILKNNVAAPMVKDTSAQNNKKREGSSTEEKRINKKAKTSFDPIACPENLTMLGGNSVDVSQEAVDASTNKLEDANGKKKKRVLTKERKAKKKKNDRIKRAEKNRKLGVKRLKLEPVIKEKKITYCRHYLIGRCHEGEKCKFSHDTTPLTKSKPCCHFARHSCMKGDDCPFDHQLSKYPCNNFISKGFCSRGSDCMFSHEAPLNAPNELKPEHKALPALENLGSKKKNNIEISSREKGDKKTCATSNAQRNLVETTSKLSAHPPKGISFRLSQETLPKEICTSPKVDAKVVVQDACEMTKTPTVAPRGINFLSFGKRPNNSNGGFSFKMGTGVGIGKAPLANLESDGDKNYQNTPCNVNDKKVNSDSLGNGAESSRKSMSMPMLPFMSSSMQKSIRSTLDFASKFESGVKANRPLNLTHKL